MSYNIQIIERLVDKYRFKQPVPDAVRNSFSRYKLKALVSTLKDANEFNVFYGMVLKVHSIFNRSGLGISIAGSRIIFGIIALIAGVVLTAGAVISVNALVPGKLVFPGTGRLFQNDAVINGEKHPAEKPGDTEERNADQSVNGSLNQEGDAGMKSVSTAGPDNIFVNMDRGKENIISIDKKAGDKASQLHGKGTKETLSEKNMPLWINTIKAYNVDETAAREITEKIFAGLCDLKSRERVYLKDNDKRNISGGNQLIGSINKIGNRYLLTIAVLDGRTGEHIFDSSFSFNRDASIETELKDLINQISGNKEIWMEQNEN